MVTASCSMASRLFMSTPSRAAVQRSWKRAGIPGHPDPATTMENDASALQNMGHPDDAALLESRARDIRGQTCLTSGQTALYFAPECFGWGLPDEIGDKQARQALPIASHSLSRSGRRRQAKYGKGWAIYAFPRGCRWPSLKELTAVRPQPIAGDNTHEEAHLQQRDRPIYPWR
jgi:hypothetical protein